MIWGGLLILIFLVVHVSYFRFGPGIAEGYTVQIDRIGVVIAAIVAAGFIVIPLRIYFG